MLSRSHAVPAGPTDSIRSTDSAEPSWTDSIAVTSSPHGGTRLLNCTSDHGRSPPIRGSLATVTDGWMSISASFVGYAYYISRRGIRTWDEPGQMGAARFSNAASLGYVYGLAFT